MSIFHKVQQPYKKRFTKHRDKLYKTFQSRKIKIESETYVFVGQMRLQQFPLFSHFDVFDHTGESADERLGRRVYSFISILMLAKYLRDVEEQLDQFSPREVDADEISKWFNLGRKEDGMLLARDTGEQEAAFHTLLDKIDYVVNKEHWEEEDLRQIEKLWAYLWNVYERRATALLTLYEKNTFHNHAPTKEKSWINPLQEEASMLHHLYNKLTPLHGEKVTHSIHELIAFHYEPGRVKQEDEPLEKDNKVERGLYAMMTGIYRVFLWVFVPVVLIASFSDDVNVSDLLPLFTFPFIAIILRKQNKKRLIAKNNTYLADMREQHILEAGPTQAKQETAPSTSVRAGQKRQPILYDTVVISVDLVKVFVVLTATFFIVTIALFLQESMDNETVKYVFYVDLVMAAFTLWLPFSPLARRRIVVTDRAIHVRKEQISAREMKSIVCKGKGKDIDVFVTYNDNPFKWRVAVDDQGPLKETLKSWCRENGIPFQDKDVVKK